MYVNISFYPEILKGLKGYWYAVVNWFLPVCCETCAQPTTFVLQPTVMWY